MSIKPWYRFPESESDDDNPDIEKYLGNGEIAAAYRQGDAVFSFMLRNNFRTENRRAIQVDWSFPIGGKLNGYVQYFNGYGESNRIGVGILLTNWL